jgi:CRP-like cAMP-binding protein
MPQDRSREALLASQLLSGLPGQVQNRLLPLLIPTTFIRGQTLREPDIVNDYAFFITKGLVSYFDEAPGLCTGVMVGREGLVGYSCLLNERHVTFLRAIALFGGSALRISVSDLRLLATQLPPLRDRLMRYVEAMMAQNAQLAACNGQHDLLPRCARWLLMAHDRMGDEDLLITHEYLSSILGARRPAITNMLCELEREGLLERGRGHVRVRNRAGLEGVVCRCYHRIMNEFARLRCEPPRAVAAD